MIDFNDLIKMLNEMADNSKRKKTLFISNDKDMETAKNLFGDTVEYVRTDNIFPELSEENKQKLKRSQDEHKRPIQ